MGSVKEVPGDYGLPLLGAIRDRLDFYYFQGEVGYFKSRAKKYRSNVFRVNFVPGPPGFPSPRGVALLDQRCFPVLFDTSKVSKRDVFVGPFKPHDSFNGGTRILAYLDTTEEKHKVLKDYVFQVLKSVGPRFITQFESTFKAAFDKLEVEMAGEYDALALLEQLAFDFMLQSFLKVESPSSELGPDGVSMLKTWIGIQFAPNAGVGATGLPLLVEDLAMRNFPLSSFFVSSNYNRLLDFFRKHATEMLDMAQQNFKLGREEALHNLVFLVGVNGWLGFSKMLPSITHYIGSLSREQQLQLGSEIRSVLSENSNFIASVDKMELLKSAALEVLRIAPPVFYQYGRARDDFVVESDSGKFMIKAGELLGGSQAIVCRDPEVFDRPDEFVVDRFVGDDKSKLAACVFWSNGRNTEDSSVHNKQCGAKDMVETVARYYIALLFLRYETIELGQGSSPEKPVIKALSKI